MKRILTFAILLLLTIPTFSVFLPKVEAFSYPYILGVGISYEETSVPLTPPITMTPKGHMRLWYHLYNPNSYDVNVILGASIQIGSNTYDDPAHDKAVTLKPGDSISWPNRWFYVPSGVPAGSYTVLYGLWASDWSVRYDLESKSGWINMVSSVSVQLSSSPSNVGTITWDGVTYSLPKTVYTTTRIHWSGTDDIHCTPPSGYEFDHWESSGAVDPWDEYSQWTSVDVDGSGSLKAVFNAIPNSLPTVKNGYVTPTTGDTSTLFYYYVHYYDPEGVAPTNLKQLCIDGSEWHSMGLYSGSASDGTYRCILTLSAGSHNYYFKFSDGVNTVYLPSSGTYSGPTVPTLDGEITDYVVLTPTVVAGNKLKVQVTVKNIGDIRAEYNVYIGNIWDSGGNNAGNAYSESHQIFQLDPGASQTLTLEWTTPDTMLPGAYTADLWLQMAKPGGGWEKQKKYPNAIGFTVESANHAPDLSDGYVDPNPGYPDTNFKFLVKYKDQDGDPAVVKKIYVYDGGWLNFDMDHLAGNPTVGEWFIIWLRGFSLGSHDFYFYFTDGDLSDHEPSSGYYSFSVVERPKPDLIISDITWSPSSPRAGDTMTFTVYIKNQGPVDTSSWGSFDVPYYIDGGELGSWIIDNVAAGDTISRQFTWTATRDAHTVSAHVDKGGFIPESDEGNNYKEESFTVAAGTVTITGHFYYWDSKSERQWVKWAYVELWDDDNVADDLLDSAYTTEDGYFVLGPVDNVDDEWWEGESGTRDLYIKVFAWNWAAEVHIPWGVRYEVQTDTVGDVSDGEHDWGNMPVPAEQYGAYHILAVITYGNMYVDIFNGTPPMVTVWWSQDYTPLDERSYYDPVFDIIHLRGSTPDPDEWDECTILHEYGHFIMDTHFNGGTMVFGDDKVIEGWAQFFQSPVRLYWNFVDKYDDYPPEEYREEQWTVSYDLETWTDGTTEPVDYMQFASILWDIYDEPSDGRDELHMDFDEIWDVFTNYNPDPINPAHNHPWTIDEFWDGWFARGHGHRSEMNAIFWEHEIDKNTPPSVSVKFPNTWNWHRGTIDVEAEAWDTDGSVTGVWFWYNIYTSDPSDGRWEYIGNDMNPSGGWKVSWDTSSITDSSVWIKAVADDSMESSSPDVSDSHFGIDNVLPNTPSPDADPSSWSTDATPTIYSYSVSDAGDVQSGINRYEYQIDSTTGTWTNVGLASSFDVPPQPDGIHTAYVRAVDNAGNPSSPGYVYIYIDTTGPQIEIVSPVDGATVTTINVEVIWSGSDSASGIDHYEIKFDSGPWISKGVSTSHTFSAVTIGAHTVEVKAVDTTDLENTDSHTFSVSPPVLRIAAESPVNVLVTDPKGLRVGYDPVLGSLNEIPGATYSGPGTEPQEITIPDPATGTYTIDAFGTGTGAYTVTMESFASDGLLIDSQIWTGTAEPGEQFTQEVELEPDGIITDVTGPATTGTTVTPTPTKIDPTLTATITDALSTVVAAEYFIDTPGTSGTGTLLSAVDGAFDELSEDVTAIISILELIQGEHTVYLHGKDAANNWGDFDTYPFVVVKTYLLTVESTPSDTSGATFLATYTLDLITHTDEAHTTSWTTEVDVGTTFTISDPQEILDKIPDDGTRYAYATGAGPFTMDSDKTITLVYKTQYYLTMSTNFGTVSPNSGWFDSGATLTIETTAPPVIEGEKYVWLGWTGIGDISYSGMDNPAIDAVTMNSPISETASWIHEYYLTTSTNFGSVSPTSNWFEAGSLIEISATPPSAITGEQYVWNGWSGTGSGSYSGPDNPATVTLNSPISETASWIHQYYISVSSAHDAPTSSDWVDQGNDFTASVTSPTEVVEGDHQWVCRGFSVDGGPAQLGTSYIFPNVQAPYTIAFIWQKQFWIQVNSDHDSPTPSDWVDQGNSFTASVDSPADIEPEHHQWVCSGFSVDGGALQPSTSYTFINVQASHTIVFSWWEQFWVTLAYTGDTIGQYSDPAGVSASLTATETGQPLQGKTITFTIGTQSAYAITNETGIAGTNITLTQPAGVRGVTVEFAGDTIYLPRTLEEPFIIDYEDAAVDYTGDTVVPTTAKTINVRATIFDSPDGYWGDLTKIRVTFSIYAGQLGSTPFMTIPAVPVSQTDMPGIGVAVATIDVLPENGYLIIVSIDSNDYYEGPTSDATPLTVYEPTGDFVTGGGWIWDPSGSKGNFGFNAKYTKSGRPKGHSIYVYREDGWDYIVKSNAWIGLAIDGNHACFEAKCVVQMYNPETGELVWAEGNYKFRVDVWDNDGDGGVDIYQIRVLDKNGVTFHQAGFDPLGELQGGNIVIHDERRKKP